MANHQHFLLSAASNAVSKPKIGEETNVSNPSGGGGALRSPRRNLGINLGKLVIEKSFFMELYEFYSPKFWE